MVRLKVMLAGLYGAGVNNFNSSMVRLKVYCFRRVFVLSFYFNSSMVRLKAAAQ